jgi:hypothetical protein
VARACVSTAGLGSVQGKSTCPHTLATPKVSMREDPLADVSVVPVLVLFLYFIISFSPSSCLQQTVGNVLLSAAYPRMHNRAMNAVRHQEQGTEHGQAFLNQLLDKLLFVDDVECASDGRVLRHWNGLLVSDGRAH